MTEHKTTVIGYQWLNAWEPVLLDSELSCLTAQSLYSEHVVETKLYHPWTHICFEGGNKSFLAAPKEI